MIYYVSASASKDGDGSKNMPFKHIDDAARIAKPGDEVIVAPGIYREHVVPRHAGTDDRRIVYRSEKPLAAVITGAEEMKGWKKYKGDVWTARVNNGVFGSYNPYVERVCGDWYFAPAIRHTGSVYLNDLAMYEADSLKTASRAPRIHAHGTRRNPATSGSPSRTATRRSCMPISAVWIPIRRRSRSRSAGTASASYSRSRSAGS